MKYPQRDLYEELDKLDRLKENSKEMGMETFGHVVGLELLCCVT